MDEKNNNKNNFDFSTKIINAFKFIIENYNFKLCAQLDDLVRFESNKAYVEFSHDSYSFELSCDIGLLNDDRHCSIVDLLDYRIEPKENFYPLFQASNEQRMKKTTILMAKLLQMHGDLLLKGIGIEFDKLQKFIQDKSERITADFSKGKDIRDANLAWRNKDYKKYIELMGRLGNEHLSALDKKRLAYALKTSGRTNDL